MLTLLLGKDWVSNRNAIMNMIAKNVKEQRGQSILIVPELISHDAERRLAAAAGDSASRFAEVLSFSRMADRVADIVGNNAVGCLDNGGRVVAMAAAVYQVNSRLKAYASVGTKPEFLTGLVEAVDEFKRCCISPSDLMKASVQTEGSFAQKLEELALILESYDSVCAKGKRDPRDQMMWLQHALSDCDYCECHAFYIDGFPDFTRQHAAIVEELICKSENVTMSFLCDMPDSSDLAFEKAGETVSMFIKFAKAHCIPVKITYVESNQTLPYCDRLFQGEIKEVSKGLNLFKADSVYKECEAVAEKILHLVYSGVRYRDIGVVCCDIATYQAMLETVCERCHIPLYLAGTENVLDKNVIATVLSAIDTAINGFEQKDVLRYLKTSLSPLDDEICDLFENYVIAWGISGKRWLSEWTGHPDGIGEKWTQESRNTLSKLNDARKKVVLPLEKLRNSLKTATTVGKMTLALYEFLTDISLEKKLESMALELENEEDYRGVQVLNQLWEILILAMEQMYDALCDCPWPPDVFSRLFKLLLSQYNVGTIPSVLDAVIAGPVSAMRCQQTKHLFVLGAKEGSFPAYGGTTGVLSDSERNQLRTLGLPLTGGALEGLKIEFSEIYGVFAGAQESITVSCPACQHSFVFQRLAKMTSVESVSSGLGAVLANPLDAAAYIMRNGTQEDASSSGVLPEFHTIEDKCNYEFGDVSAENIKSLYGNTIRLSASQIDKLANCPFAHYMHYGLRLKERKPYKVDPAQFGTYIHDVLEKTVSEVMQKGGFSVVSEDEMLEIAFRHSDIYAQNVFGELDTERLQYLFNRNTQELKMIVSDLWNELHLSKFTPKYFELSFDDKGALPPIDIPAESMNAKLRGFVDRVDVWNDADRTYFRVVDYKTGEKSFDYCDIINGIGLQMLLYLFALEENGEELLGDKPIPAGVQYMPARAPVISVQAGLDQNKLDKKRAEKQKRKGLLLANDIVLEAIEPAEAYRHLSYTRKKDGSISGDTASVAQFDLLKNYVFKLLKEMVNDIASGNIKPNPYYRDDRNNACRYCPYGAVCHRSDVPIERLFKAVSAEEFWKDIGKEMAHHG